MTFFTSDESAMYYECGYSCDNAILLKNGDEMSFITDSRYTLEAREAVKKRKDSIEIISSNDLVESLCARIKNAKNVIFNPLEISHFTYEKVRQSGANLTPKENFHQLLRIKKSYDEIALIKESQRLNKKAFKRFAKYLNRVKKYSDERYLQFKARSFLESCGKYELSFSPICAINHNAAKPHALPSKDKLKKGDLLLLDAGIKYKRYCSDMTRTADFSGNLSFSKKQIFFTDKKRQKIYDIVLKAQENAIKRTRAGMKACEVDNLARSVIEKAGYGEFFTHSTGHGIGLDIHELPRISARSDTIIEDGMVFSIEPGIYLAGEFGVRIEDLVVIRGGRAEVL